MSRTPRLFILFVFIFTSVFSVLAEAKSRGVAEVSSVDVMGPFPYEGPEIFINIPARKMYLFDHRQFVKSYDVAVGSAVYRTPIGNRALEQIVWNPWWLPPKDSAWAKNAKDTPPGPNNPLGPVKMKLGDTIMIHGTNKPDSVGRAASHGCMRMKNEEAFELAKYLQERAVGITDPVVYDNYTANRRKSFYVAVPTPVPVHISYEIAILQNGFLTLYPDVYGKVRDRMELVKSMMLTQGHDVAAYDFEFLKARFQTAPNNEITLAIDEFSVAALAKSSAPTASGPL